MPSFDYRITVALHDIDAAGVMFFAHFFRHAHDAYEKFMAEQGCALDALLREGRFLLPLVGSEASFRQPLRHGESITIRLNLSRLGESSFTMRYRFLGGDGTMHAEVSTSHVWIDAVTRRSNPLPALWRERLQLYLDAESPD